METQLLAEVVWFHHLTAVGSCAFNAASCVNRTFREETRCEWFWKREVKTWGCSRVMKSVLSVEPGGETPPAVLSVGLQQPGPGTQWTSSTPLQFSSTLKWRIQVLFCVFFPTETWTCLSLCATPRPGPTCTTSLLCPTTTEEWEEATVSSFSFIALVMFLCHRWVLWPPPVWPHLSDLTCGHRHSVWQEQGGEEVVLLWRQQRVLGLRRPDRGKTSVCNVWIDFWSVYWLKLVIDILSELPDIDIKWYQPIPTCHHRINPLKLICIVMSH